MQNKILWKKCEEDFWNWKTHQVVVMGPLSSMSSDYSQSFFPDRWKTAWGRVSGSCLAGSLQSSTLQVGWIPLDWESPKRKGQCLTLSSHQSQCQPLFSRHEVTEVRPRAPLGCLLSSVRGCTQGAWAGWWTGSTAEPSIRGQNVEEHARELGVDAVSSTRSIPVSISSKCDSQPFFFRNPDTSALSEPPWLS